MKATGLWIRHWYCFRESWAGFERFPTFNILVGRNNSGKSQLLDLAARGVAGSLKELDLPEHAEVRVRFQLSEGALEAKFRDEGRSSLPGGHLWRNYGSQLAGAAAELVFRNGVVASVELKDDAETMRRLFSKLPNVHEKWKAEVRERVTAAVKQSAAAVWPPFRGYHIGRLHADRDIVPESTQRDGVVLAPDGKGATNLIRRFVSTSDARFPREIIREDLLVALNHVFAADGKFEEITVQEHEDHPSGPTWEVFLGEREKGLVALSRSGSGLKTVILVLLHLLAIPKVTEGDRPFLFAFEELENNLHPALLRRLLHFVADNVRAAGATLFLTTHSSVVLDFFAARDDAQVVQIAHDNKQSTTRPIKAHFDRLRAIADLGARPSDLLQANGIIWVEGPSDRIYLNRWIEIATSGELREGIDYQCAADRSLPITS
jgi:hypothetical protein